MCSGADLEVKKGGGLYEQIFDYQSLLNVNKQYNIVYFNYYTIVSLTY